MKQSHSQLHNKTSDESHALRQKQYPSEFARAHKNGVLRAAVVIPGLIISALSYIFPLYKHVLPRAIFTAFLLCMIIETHFMLPASMKPRRIAYSLAAGLLFPLFIWIAIFAPSFTPHRFYAVSTLLVIFIFVLSVRVLIKNVSNLIESIGGLLFLAVYPGLLGACYLALPGLTGNNTVHFVMVTGMVYSSDGMAYLTGRFFGKKNNTPVVRVSASKTTVGFIGGFISGIIYFYIVYGVQLYTGKDFFAGSVLKTLLFACVINTAGMLGDLFESALKRSSYTKNSGAIMLGRGGVLDTFDSLLTASAAYYILYPLFY